ncbi:MAG TPA: hypothetical protein VM577_13780 [Anaerovoracaceae bacterium]|nr:hypothetical protein [Anaerovoracaceae bacterium]
MANVISYLTGDKQAQYDELLARFADLDEKEAEALMKLKKELQTNKGKRAGDVEKVKKQLTELNISLEEIYGETLTDVIAAQGLTVSRLFSDDLIREYATTALGMGKKAAKDAAKADGEPTQRAPATERPSAKNPVLLAQSTEGGRGRGFSYHQGRVFEQATGTVKTPFVYADKQFPKALLMNGHTASSLMKIATEEGKTYFATEEGKKELEAILAVVKTAHEKLGNPQKQAA